MNVSPFQERAKNYRSIYAVAEVLKMVSSGASDEARSLIHTRHYWRVKRLQDAGYMRAERVSIHTRHYWRVKPLCVRNGRLSFSVSIHTRHYWRVKPCQRRRWRSRMAGFNPHPPLLAGETNDGSGRAAAHL